MGLDESKRKRVAIVDDCPDVRFLLATVIELDDRFEVVAEAADGEGALAAVAASSPDLVLVDLDLGADDGASLIRDMRRSGTTACVVVVTASADAADHAAAFNAGADGLQSKCAMTSTMVDALAELVDRHPGGVIRHASAVADPESGWSWLSRLDRVRPVGVKAPALAAH